MEKVKCFFNFRSPYAYLGVKKAIEELFEVKVVAVNIILKKGKPKTFGRNRITTPIYKKAIVSLASGQTINISEGT